MLFDSIFVKNKMQPVQVGTCTTCLIGLLREPNETGHSVALVSCKTLDKNERVLLGICGLAGSYRWQSPVIMKAVFNQSRNSSDFSGSRGSELYAVTSVPSLARDFICQVYLLSGFVSAAVLG